MYVLPYGQMSLWGLIFKPQMHNLYLFLFILSIYHLFIEFLLHISPFNWDNSSSTQSVRLKSKYRIGPHNKDILCIIFGSLLGDAHAEKIIIGTGTRITFYLEYSHVDYMLYLHSLISMLGYCNSAVPIIGTRLGLKGKVRKTVRFSTWTYNSFNWIHEVWYVNGIKRIPDNISLYLTPLALAIWIMNDGGKVSKGLKFNINSYTYEDCLKLVLALNNNFGIKSSIQYAGAGNQYIIHVWKESMDKLREIVGPHIIKEMRYKID